jgi:hypothetical protein
MNRRLLAVTGLAVAATLGAATVLRSQITNLGMSNMRRAILSSCEGSAMLFDRQPEGNLNRWMLTYNDAVSTVVDDVLEKSANPTCTLSRDDDVPPSLTILARKLSPWEDTGTPVRLADAPAVLLETLRVYECTLREWNTFLPVTTSGSGSEMFSIIGPSTQRQLQDRLKIEQELSIARPTMNRTLTYLGGVTRLTPLSQNMDCLVRTSADLRNVLGLAAETSMCLPRAWDTKGTVQNLSE